MVNRGPRDRIGERRRKPRNVQLDNGDLPKASEIDKSLAKEFKEKWKQKKFNAWAGEWA